MASSSTSERLTLTGPLTIGTVARWHPAIVEALGSGRPLVLDLEDVGACDAAGLQLLVAACRAGGKAGAPTVRLERVARAVAEVVEQAAAGRWLGLDPVPAAG